MAAGSRQNREKSKKSGSVGLSISNKPGTFSHRAWTFLNTGVDPGPFKHGKDKTTKKR